MEGLVLQRTHTVPYDVRTEFLYGRNFEERQSSKRQKYYNLNFSVPFIVSGPGSVVGIAIGYGLDGPGIEYR